MITPTTSGHSLSPHFAPVVTGGTSWEVESCAFQSCPHELDTGPGSQSPPLPKAGVWLTAVGTGENEASPSVPCSRTHCLRSFLTQRVFLEVGREAWGPGPILPDLPRQLQCRY